MMEERSRRGGAVTGGWSGQCRRPARSGMALRGGLRVALAVLVVVIGACTQPEEFSRQPGTVVQEGGRPVQRGSGGSGGAGEKRVALVVGNSEYEHISRLRNAVNDATDMAAALGRLGFGVTKLEDASHEEFNAALKAFVEETESAEMAMVFYAGHGMEMDGVNYVVPVDAQMVVDTQVPYETLTLEQLENSTAGARLRVVILDACRNLPALRRMERRGGSRSVSGGSFSAPELAGDTLVGYAAKAGQEALDGKEGQRNSPYTAALLSQLEQPQELTDVFKAVRRQVMRETEDWDKGPQRPFEYGSLTTDYYLAGKPEESASTVSDGPGTRLETVRMDRERAYWESAERGGRAEDYEDYLRRYPEGEFADFARRRLRSLRGQSSESLAGGGSAGSAGGSSDPARRDLDGDRAFWEEIRESRDPEDYAAYLRAHPRGVYVELAQRRLRQYREEEAEEEEAWRVATAGNRLEGFMGYLREYPEGRHAEGARGRVRELADAKAEHGATGLHWAADNNAEEVARELLAAGAAVDAKGNLGATPLYLAAMKDAEGAMRVLLEHGASRGEVGAKYRGRLP